MFPILDTKLWSERCPTKKSVRSSLLYVWPEYDKTEHRVKEHNAEVCRFEGQQH